MNKTVKGHITALLCITIWSSILISTKLLLKGLQPIDLLFWRFLIGYVSLWMIRPHKMKVQNWKDEFLFAVCGLTGVNLYFMFQNTALTITAASDVSIIICVAPMITALLSQIVHRKKDLTKYFYIGFVIAIIGIILVCESDSAGTASMTGDLITGLAAVSWGIYSIVGEKLSRKGYDTIASTRRFFFYGIITMLPIMIWQPLTPIGDMLKPAIWVNLIYMGVGASAIAYMLWNISAERIGVVKTNVYLYLLPVFTIAFSAIALNEKITIAIVGGAVLTVLGMMISEQKTMNHVSENDKILEGEA